MWTLQEYGSRTQWTGCIEIGRPECSAYPDYRKMIQGCIGCNCSSRSLRIPSLMELHTLKLKPSTLTKLSSSSSSSFTLTASGERLVADLTILLSSLCQVSNSCLNYIDVHCATVFYRFVQIKWVRDLSALLLRIPCSWEEKTCRRWLSLQSQLHR